MKTSRKKIFSKDKNSVYISCNDNYARDLNLKPDEIVGKTDYDFYPKELAEKYRANDKRTMQSGKTEDMEEAYVQDGQEVFVHTVKTPIRDGDGNVVGILGVFWDITERKRAEEQREKALHDTRERMKELACIYQVTDLSQAAGTVEELFHDVVTVIPSGWHYQEIARAKVRLDGREYVSQPFEETPWKQSSDIVVGGEKRGVVEVYYLEERPDLDEGPFVQEERDLIDGLARVLSEAAERKQAEDALRKLSLAVEQSPAPVIITDTVGNIEYVNPRFTQVTGYTLEEALGKNPRILKSGETPPEEYKRLWDTITAGGQWRGEFRNKKKNGELYWESASISPVTNAEGVITHFLAVKEDITERKQAEGALQESEEKYRDLFENATDLVQSVRQDGSLVYVNRAWRQALGYSEDEIAALSLFDIIHPDNKAHCTKIFQRVMSGAKVDHIEAMFLTKHGRTIWVEGSASCRFEDGKPIATRGIFHDISERKQAQEERDRLHAELQVRAITDGLTGLYNHAHFFDRLAEEIDRSKRYGRGFALVMMDVDKFKQFNGTRGHQAGDDTLCLIADCIRTGVRRSDIAFRYGGDEFAAILLHADSSRAQAIAKRINRCVTRRLEEANDPAAAWLGLSAGITCFPDDATTADDLVKVADDALYDAKRVSRPCSAIEQAQPAEPLAAAGAAGRRKG